MPTPESRRRVLLRPRSWIIGLAVLAVIVVGALSPSHPSHVKGEVAPSPIATFDEEATVDAPSTQQPSAPPQIPVTITDIANTPALALLAKIPVKPALTMAGYDRTGDFGAAWLDENHNGCDTRNDILARDLTEITKSGDCKVMTGLLVSPYTGALIHFERGVKTSALVQIDHIVALGDAWETGAQALNQAERETLANDPLELLAVDGRSNDEKGDKGASQWLPGNAAFDCTYVARQVSVKVSYRLWVTPAEHSAMVSVLAHCPGQKGA